MTHRAHNHRLKKQLASAKIHFPELKFERIKHDINIKAFHAWLSYRNKFFMTVAFIPFMASFKNDRKSGKRELSKIL